jgi:hypothetical protein
VAVALSELGRREQALPGLRLIEEKTKTRIRDFIMAGRTMLEGDTEASVAAVERIVASDFSDPEGLFYLARHLSRLGQADSAVDLLDRVIRGGYSCYPAFATDPWLDPVREDPRFVTLLALAEQRHKAAANEFARLSGDRILGMIAAVSS